MLTFLFEQRLKKNHSELIDSFVDAIYDTISDRSNSFFCEYLNSFDSFIDFASNSDEARKRAVKPIYICSKKYKNGRIITKDKIEIDIFSKYISICNMAYKIYFIDYNMQPLRRVYQATAFRNILCKRLTEKMNDSVRAYAKTKYSPEEYNKSDVKAYCRQLYNYTCEKSKIPSLRLCLTAADPYVELLGKTEKW